MCINCMACEPWLRLVLSPTQFSAYPGGSAEILTCVYRMHCLSAISPPDRLTQQSSADGAPTASVDLRTRLLAGRGLPRSTRPMVKAPGRDSTVGRPACCCCCQTPAGVASAACGPCCALPEGLPMTTSPPGPGAHGACKPTGGKLDAPPGWRPACGRRPVPRGSKDGSKAPRGRRAMRSALSESSAMRCCASAKGSIMSCDRARSKAMLCCASAKGSIMSCDRARSKNTLRLSCIPQIDKPWYSATVIYTP